MHACKSGYTGYLLGLILIAHAVLGGVYSVTVPLWEGYDEWAHFRYVQYVTARRALPPPGLEIVTEPGMPDELFQPPLYYLLGALVTSALGTDDGLPIAVNPHAFSGTGAGGVNVAVHDPRVEGFPYRGTVLAVHALRLVSVLIGTLAVWATYLIGRTVFAERWELALAGAAFSAFVPQFLFMGSIVNNDILAAGVSAFVLLLSVRLISSKGCASDVLLLLGCLGAGIVTKHTVIATLPVALVALVIAGSRRAEVRGALPVLLSVAGGCVAFLGCAWFVLRAVPDGLWGAGYLAPVRDHLRAIGASLTQMDRLPWHLPLDAWRYGFQTFWASFGWGNVAVPEWVYWTFGVLCLLAAAGVLRFLLLRTTRRQTQRLVGVLVLQTVTTVLVVAYREALLERVLLKGRYLLVALPAISLLIVLGLSELTPLKWRSVVLWMLCVAMFAFALVTPFAYIMPVYARPPALTAAEIAGMQHPLYEAVGDMAEILGYDVGTGRVRAGEAIAVTLYWRALREVERNETVGVSITGVDYATYGETHTYPGRGNFATTLWRPGDTFRETYWVPVSPDAPAPCLGRIRVALFAWRGEDGEGSAGETVGSIVFGDIGIRPKSRTKPDIPRRTDARFGDVALLLGWELERGAGPDTKDLLKLYWQTSARVDVDYTVFVHVLDGSGRQVAGWDGPPRRGLYPTTAWEPGEVVVDERVLEWPSTGAEGFRLGVGLYRTDTMGRVPAFDRDGMRLSDDVVYLEVS